MNAKQLIKEVNTLFDSGQFQKIIELLSDAVLKEHNSAELYAWRSFAHYTLDHNDEALADATQSIKIDPNYGFAYRQRGYVYFDKGKYDDAIADQTKTIELAPNDSSAYYARGRAWRKKGELDKAIADFDKSLELDNTVADTYFGRGVTWHDKGDYDRAIADYDKSIELGEIAAAHYNRGLAWHKKGEFDKAIADFTRTLDLQKDFSDAYNDRGISQFSKQEYDEAIRDYSKAIKAKEDYKAYNNRGLAWQTKGEFENALKDYNKAVALSPDYANGFRNRGLLYYEKGDYQRALRDFEKAISLDKTFIFLDYNVKLAKEKLEERKKLDASNAAQAHIAEKIKIENSIDKAVSIIMAAAISKIKTVVHYTKVSVADIYVKVTEINGKREGPKMHYSNAIYMNDPQEGKVFFEYLDHAGIEEAYRSGEKRTETSVYLGSFLPAEESDGIVSHEDELVMWRTYGKDENGKEAAGCSVVLDSNFFKANSSKQDEAIGKNSYDEQLLNVVYVKKEKNIREITNESKTKISPEIKNLKKELGKLLQLREKYDKTHDFYKDIENTIFKKLSLITYLFKSADYEYEHEVRVIIYMPRDSNLIKHMPNTQGPSKRFYIESYNYILPSIKKIYLGPKVENYQQWSLYLDYEIRQRAKEQPNTIKPAEIEIIKSDCKFQ